MIAIHCVVENDTESAVFWNDFFAEEGIRSICVDDLDSISDPAQEFPGGLLLVGKEALKEQPTVSLEEVLQNLFLDSKVTPPREFGKASIQECISRFSANNVRVCGVGAGALDAAQFLDLSLQDMNSLHLGMDPIRYNDDDATQEFVPRMAFATIKGNNQSHVRVVAQLNDDKNNNDNKTTICVFETPLILGVHASPDLPCDALLDYLELLNSVEDAERTIESVQRFGPKFTPSSLLLRIQTFFCPPSEAPSALSATSCVVDELCAKIASLEEENAALRNKLASLVLVSTTTDQEENSLQRDMDRLLGKNDVFLHPVLKLKNVLAETTVVVSPTPAAVLSVCFVGQNLVYGLTNKQIHCVNTKEVVYVDAPPVIFATSTSTLHLLAVGTLSGSIHLYYSEVAGGPVLTFQHVGLASPHRKHLLGLHLSRTHHALFSLSRDLTMVLWPCQTNDFVPETTLQFEENQPPECSCVVSIGNVEHVVIARRNCYNLIGFRFDFQQDVVKKQKLIHVDLALGETALSMTSCGSDLPVLALATDKGRILVLDVRNGGALLRCFFAEIADEYARPSLVYANNWLACTRCQAAEILLFSLQSGEMGKPLVVEHSALVRCLAFGLVDHVTMLAAGSSKYVATHRFVTEE